MASQQADTKRERLVELKNRMKEHFAQKFPESRLCFFEDDSVAVAGYLGTDPVMFVGQRPSTGRGGTSKAFVGGFYGLLVDYGFANAHITDIVKESMRAGTPSWEQVERNWPYFEEELRIIEPKIIVAMGGWVFYTLGQRLNWPVSLRRVTHYSYRFVSRSELEKRLRAELQMIRKDSGPA